MTDSHPPEAGASFTLPAHLEGDYDALYGPVHDGPAHDGPVRRADAPPVLHDANLGRPPHTAPGPGGSLIAPWLGEDPMRARPAETKPGRRDGWTPIAKRTFHERLADGDTVADAANAAGMSATAAYNLRNRDPLFDAGWDAALLLARRRLADELYARSLKGCIEQIHKDGAIVAERHRYDNRLSMAVLHRLDARCDRAEARGDTGVRVARRWDEYLDATGEDRAADAAALLIPPPTPAEIAAAAAAAAAAARASQLSQLRESPPARTDWHSVWLDDAGDAWTDYPPPPGFDPEDEDGRYGEDDYKRMLTPAEADAYEASDAYPDAPVAAEDIGPEMHAQRDSFFEGLRPRAGGGVPESSPERGEDEPDDDDPDDDDPDDDEPDNGGIGWDGPGEDEPRPDGTGNDGSGADEAGRNDGAVASAPDALSAEPSPG